MFDIHHFPNYTTRFEDFLTLSALSYQNLHIAPGPSIFSVIKMVTKVDFGAERVNLIVPSFRLFKTDTLRNYMY